MPPRMLIGRSTLLLVRDIFIINLLFLIVSLTKVNISRLSLRKSHKQINISEFCLGQWYLHFRERCFYVLVIITDLKFGWLIEQILSQQSCCELQGLC